VIDFLIEEVRRLRSRRTDGLASPAMLGNGAASVTTTVVPFAA
jgi:hypothetical protein